MLSSSWRNEVFAPGALSVHHTQLVARDDAQTNRCASCHAAGNQSFVQWLSHTTDPTLSQPTQSELCLNCHDKTIPRDTALLAHGVPSEALFAGHRQDAISRRVDPHGSFACSTCHREHHGATFDIKAMSNTACQACHRQQYHSFATDHPEFKDWPEHRRTRIAFDHAAHQAKHFPAEKQEFSCRECHQKSITGFEQTLGYQASCARCHDSDIAASWKSGIDFVSLPMIDTEALADAGHAVGPWPEAATGDFDGPLSLLARLLLLSNPEAAQGIEQLGSDFDFFDVDPADADQLAAAATIIGEVKKLSAELAEQGHEAIGTRLEKLVGRDLTLAELAAAVAHLSPENMSAPQAKWLAEVETTKAEHSDVPLATGGWVRDDTTFNLRYQPAGHDDLLPATWISLLAEATRGSQSKLAEALLIEMMKPTAPGMCGSCHSVDHNPAGGLTVNWLAKQDSDGRGFTKFSHAPHVLQTQLADCSSCHRFTEATDVMATYAQANPTEFATGFHDATKQDCATCHKSGAAGDSCTQCHNYHIRDAYSP